MCTGLPVDTNRMVKGNDPSRGTQGSQSTNAPIIRPESHKVLIVDDSAICREPLLAALKLKGFQAKGAADGEAALASIRSEIPDLVVLDVMMPEMDGWSVLRALRRNPLFNSLPVILLTAMVDNHCVTLARELGVREYLLKEQFSIEDLYARIRRVLGLPAERSALGMPAQPDAAVIARMVASANTLKGTITELTAILQQFPQLADRLVEAADSNAATGTGPHSNRALHNILLKTIREIASGAAAA
jgi:CheY-like chemotaxis protein